MKVIRSADKGFEAALASITGRGQADTSAVENSVKDIISGVRERGDRAVAEYTMLFDGVDLKGRFEVTAREINSAFKSLPKKEIELLELAARRVEDYHRKQLPASWSVTAPDGTVLGARVTAIERAAIYVPGGKAAYPSTAIMNAVPAKVAGVDDIVMATPPGAGGINPYVLAAAKIAGVDRVLRVGGAQAIAALAYGTRSIPKADKITGPGNIYVATAKRLVYGAVDIDMIAGPSEILVINDGTGDARWIAADLLSQAEHDEMASSMLITTSAGMAAKVRRSVDLLLKKLKRRSIARESVDRYGIIIVARSIEEAAMISNRIAPEHLELFVEKPFELLGLIRNAGAIFLGTNTPEAIGDYIAGPNHTLPTGGAARFSSPLGTEDFVKRSSVICFSAQGMKTLGPGAGRLARIEGLGAHALSVDLRLGKN